MQILAFRTPFTHGRIKFYWHRTTTDLLYKNRGGLSHAHTLIHARAHLLTEQTQNTYTNTYAVTPRYIAEHSTKAALIYGLARGREAFSSFHLKGLQPGRINRETFQKVISGICTLIKLAQQVLIINHKTNAQRPETEMEKWKERNGLWNVRVSQIL